MFGRVQPDPFEDFRSVPDDQDAWKSVTPWRPSSGTTGQERDYSWTLGGGDQSSAASAANKREIGCDCSCRNTHSVRGESGEWSSSRGWFSGGPVPGSRYEEDRGQQRSGRWWTEEVTEPYRSSERVRATGNIDGILFTQVPTGTRGVVESTRQGLLGDRYATVRFDNGYTREVRESEIRRDSWW